DVARGVADGGQNIGYAAELADALFELAHDAVALGERMASGRLHDHLELALIVVGNEIFPDGREERHDPENREDARGDHDPAVAQRPAQNPAVRAVDPRIEAAFLRRLAGVLGP